MKRFFYRCLIWLHPPAFRQRFGDEMLSIFDDSAETQNFPIFADSVISLLRQWLVRSGAWKLALGTAMSGMLFLALASGMEFSQRASLIRYQETHQVQSNHLTPIDRAAFSLKAAQAVAMLARFEKDNANKHDKKRRDAASPLVQPTNSQSKPD
jgi:hypothetical protein